MKLSDDLLKAYFNGEVDLVTRAEIEAAIARDPGLARIAENHRASPAPAAPTVPAPARPAAEPAATVQPAPAAVEPAMPGAPAVPAAIAAFAARWKLPPWGLPAAALLFGLVIGKFVLNGGDAPYAEAESGLVARGQLAWALNDQLASDEGTGAVRIGSSFRDRSGAWCRTFRLQHEAPFAGLACRSGDDWRLPLLVAAVPGEIGSHEVTVMPMAVLRAVDAAIDGEPLDAVAEAAARNADWQ